jgi:hypothetical protein
MTGQRCRSCNAPIEWVRMQSGRANPVDPVWVVLDPSDTRGTPTVIVCDNGTMARGRAVRQSGQMPADIADLRERGYVVGRPSHFATCPHAGTHRRR